VLHRTLLVQLQYLQCPLTSYFDWATRSSGPLIHISWSHQDDSYYECHNLTKGTFPQWDPLLVTQLLEHHTFLLWMLLYLGKEDLIIPVISNMVSKLGSPKQLSELAGLIPGINSYL
jgi:hypothetical protein